MFVIPAMENSPKASWEKPATPLPFAMDRENLTLAPILEGAHCEHLEDARGVVFQFDLDDPVIREVLQKYKEIVPLEIPIRVVVSEEQREKYEGLLEGFEVWNREPTVADLDGFAAEVEAADYAAEATQDD